VKWYNWLSTAVRMTHLHTQESRVSWDIAFELAKGDARTLLGFDV
jgi:hypothetical protein